MCIVISCFITSSFYYNSVCCNRMRLWSDEKNIDASSTSVERLNINVCFASKHVTVGSPSRGGDVAVYVFDINQPSLPTAFYSVLASICLYGPFNCISFHKFSR